MTTCYFPVNKKREKTGKYCNSFLIQTSLHTCTCTNLKYVTYNRQASIFEYQQSMKSSFCLILPDNQKMCNVPSLYKMCTISWWHILSWLIDTNWRLTIYLWSKCVFPWGTVFWPLNHYRPDLRQPVIINIFNTWILIISRSPFLMLVASGE